MVLWINNLLLFENARLWGKFVQLDLIARSRNGLFYETTIKGRHHDNAASVFSVL